MPTFEERFWSKVDRSGGPDACWPWTRATVRKGYGSTTRNGKHRLTHRLAWEIAHGEIPVSLLICHSCDNPPCCNPAHLFAGTHRENMADMKTKGRSGKGIRGGSPPQRPDGSYPQAKLTPESVRAIRRLSREGASYKSLAEKFGVTPSNIYAIVVGKTWKSVA